MPAAAYTWVAAAIGSQNASGYQPATGAPVMAVGDVTVYDLTSPWPRGMARRCPPGAGWAARPGA